MYFYWAIIAPILPALAIFLSAVLIKEKKRLRIILLSIISVFNIYISFNLINIFRRDYNGDFSIFPLSNYIAYLIIVNVVFLSFSLLILMKLDAFKENRFIISVQSFFCKLKKSIFMLEKTTDKLLSIFLLICLFYIVGFLNVYIHEFGHAMADVLVGTYYIEIRINFFLQGWASGHLMGDDEFLLLKANIISFGGLVAECVFASISLFIILRKKEKNSFTWLLSIVISMLILNRVLLYFTFPQFFNIRSDVLSLVNTGWDSWIIFFIFFPFLIMTFALTLKLMSRLYKTSLKSSKKFIGIYFLSLTSYIVVLNILRLIDEFITPLVSFSFY
ncbi:MAG: M50 family metallopeptidase [Candidatus Lokiarchaeota archaeon]|nr:M50 family metallopeptidase [Candidatus Lokiarchaeota archaeon]